MKRLLMAVAAFAAIATFRPVLAQSPFAVELTGGAALPVETFGDADLEAGFGFGANIQYRLTSTMAAYGGWEWHRMRSDELISGETIDIEDTGYTFGLRVEQPLAPAVVGWVRAGGIYNHFELEDGNGDLVSDSGHGLGWEVGGGLAIPISRNLALTPGVRYRTLTRDMEIGGATAPASLSYVTLGSGLVFSF